MKRFFAGLSDPGLLRTSNQDAYYLDPQSRFYIVADGMGGHAGGQEASRLATETIRAHLDQYWDSTESSKDLLHEAFLRANEAILKDQSTHPERSDMGTTAVALMFREQQLWCAHVGDSRLYRLRGATLEQITEDHTWVARAIREGELTLEQSKSHPWRHVLSQCLGREDLNHISLKPVTMQVSDRYLLCSDGLTEELSDPMIAHQLKSIRACEAAASALVEAAKARGGRDNITVVVLYLQGEAPLNS
ncbi:MAG: serine/threonine-protein phosphatase [Leptolyngbyaceae cyanobacterium SM1_1_3]|nr:serine/threonine-protein phosphatase [Leptolyngbyaceae cyanobacterium SM1_1_3]NJN04080.1 serine/threonine-protein phosphatase [Leptolyngbyaceae cyanobacterium RM1_1_2]NJO10977.1 serine/threonine-protein phosphatase [Leptolyngbyaceae cyanobacterium SL_1_1]